MKRFGILRALITRDVPPRRFQPPDAASFKRASPPGITPGDGYSAKAMEQYKEQVRAAATNADRFSPLDSTLVIVLLRNVYDWTEAMRRLPYHSPSHVNLTLNELLQASLGSALSARKS